MNIRALVAEAIGTFILLFFGSLGVVTLVIVTQGQGNPLLSVLIIPFAFGLGLMAAMAVGGPISGGHFNPAVTLAALFDGRISLPNAIGYAVAQLIGAFGASLVILLITSSSMVSATVNQPGATADTLFGSELHSFAVEGILTAVFVAVILTVTKRMPDQALLVIPFTLVAIHYVAIQISGASVNPVRSLAPAVVSGTYDSLWVYLTAPFVGSIVGWGAYRFLSPGADAALADDDADDEDDLDDEDDDELDEFEVSATRV
jgi:MIP family channel proteins